MVYDNQPHINGVGFHPLYILPPPQKKKQHFFGALLISAAHVPTHSRTLALSARRSQSDNILL